MTGFYGQFFKAKAYSKCNKQHACDSKMHFASRFFCVFHPNSVEWGEYGVFIVASQKQRPKVLTLAEYVCGRKTHFASRLFCIFYASLREWGEYQVSRGICFKKKGI